MTHLRTALLAFLFTLAACQQPIPPEILLDTDVIPVGSRITFWVNHDNDGWKESNIHIAHLPRPMTGAESRRWAEGVGDRDGGQLWTQYYVLVTPLGAHARPRRSQIHSRSRASAAWEPRSKRL